MHASSSRQHIESNISNQLAEKEELRRGIAQAAADQDDVLAAYEQFVRWLDKHEHDTSLVRPYEMLEVLEEGVRTMKDDKHYKNDLRYVKLWTMYARRVRKPDVVYAFLFKKAIGTAHSQLYEECALVLEESGKLREAEDAFKIGLKKSKRAVDRLKNRYREFQDRVASGTTFKRSTDHKKDKAKDKDTLGAALYRDPLRNFSDASSSSSATKHTSQPQTSSTSQENRARPAPTSTTTKRGEKLHIDMKLLEKDGIEMSIQEARAASLGLLNKQWAPPPPEELTIRPTFYDSRAALDCDDSPRTSLSNEDDLHTRHLRMNMRLSMAGAGEPTVTINTKEALRDVFGMYNSPDKTSLLSSSIGSKHSLVRKVEPVTPAAVASRRPTETPRDENRPIHDAKTPGSFQLFVDDEMRKENATPAPSKKVAVFCDEEEPVPLTTPASRPVLALKQSTTTPSSSIFTPYVDEDEKKEVAKPSAESQVKTVFSRVFTPVALPEKPRIDSSPSSSSADTTEDDDQDDASEVENLPPPKMSVFSRPPVSQPMHVFEDDDEDKDVFGSNAAFTKPLSVPQTQVRTEPVFRRKSIATGRQAFIPHNHQAFSSSKPINAFSQPIDIDDSDESLSQNVEEEEERDDPGAYNEDYQDYYEDEDEVKSSYQPPMGGRLGRFDIMTPIAERTMEYTMSTRAHTPTHHGEAPAASSLLEENDFLRSNADAAEAAKRLAMELQQEDGDFQEMVNEDDERTANDDLVERTCNLSLADAIVAASSFRPPNPCIPTDPKIICTLVSMVPPEPGFYDLNEASSGQFDELQRFAAKIRRNSGKSTSSKSTAGRSESYRVSLGNTRYEVVDKLGEGGFGAVFMAREVKGQQLNQDGSDDEEDEEEEDEDDEDTGLIALKLVKPRNIWEYHILRRVHSSLPSSARNSVINPHALYAFRDESFLILDYCSQGTLLDVVNRASQAGVAQQGGCLDELLVFFFAIELLKFIEAMHSAGFIHGDLKIDNCLLRLDDVPGGSGAWSGMYQSSGELGWSYKGIKMIDFGRTVDTRMFPSGQQFTSDWQAGVHDCLEMRQKRPYTYQTDYFGLASIIYSLLFGKHFEPTTVAPANFPEKPTRYKVTSLFKRYWQVDIWTRLFDVLLNPTLVRPDGALPVISELATIRVEMETWLASNCNRSTNTLKGLLKKVERCALTGLSSR
ncbi:hypothetical protein SCHPADRAFT_846870 [Schizopora paradoxa]|uniref:Kinase-like protein n=1 Tax=Schizopora paradoxa TaxID=27342 RepID=A0A0H2S6A6_9AGAM|nr:hypothetical protein SCHPADRAFT_846870 [Schizopora paradoxa]